jgi:hypothetical protein
MPALGMMLILALIGGGCSRMPLIGRFFKSADVSKSPIEITLKLHQTKVRPGDAVIAYVWIRNVGSESLTVQMVDAASMEFYTSGPTGALRVRPVLSTKEPLGELTDLEPGRVLPTLKGEGKERPEAKTFVFTTLTRKPGTYKILAIYHAVPKGAAAAILPAYAKAVGFTVAGQPSCRRDRDGVLLKEDAIQLAKRYLRRPATEAEAFLIEDPMGFLTWWITLTGDPKTLRPGEENRWAVFVHPYLATVVANRKAPIYVPKAKRASKEPSARPTMPLRPDTRETTPPLKQVAPPLQQ